ncbi:hypothetical protein [Bradyrhizobium sp. SYSU BS000235]|uniref:hypothetical protein n=1 Tax=Bradyrhizobium sp. SYSU BS000235 TaxID=3411332 RepID=UPI003C7285C4
MIDDSDGGGLSGWKAYNEDEHSMTCTVCGVKFDMRMPENIGKHLHDASGLELVEIFGSPTRRRM